MGNYLTIVSRSDFNDLYKFGHLFVHNIIPFEGELVDHVDDKPLFDAVTAYMNTYEYSTEYLLLHISRNSFAGTSVEIFIKDVVGVYALDAEAQANLSLSLDQRIYLQASCWEEKFKELNKKQSIRQSKAGKFNCFEIFQISAEERSYTENILPKYFVEDLYNDLYEGKKPDGDRPIWTYLVRYERHSPYWNDIRGFFSDAVHVFESYLQKHVIEYDIADEVPLGDVISRCGQDFDDIYHTIIQKAPSNYKIDGCNYFIVAALYLYMNSYFRDGGITMAKYLQNEQLSRGVFHQKYGNDFALAVALLGIKLGHELSYSCYYEIKHLGIFNKSINSKQDLTKSLINPATGEKLTDIEAQDLLNELTLSITTLKEELNKQKMYEESLVKDNNNNQTTIENVPLKSELRQSTIGMDDPCDKEPEVNNNDLMDAQVDPKTEKNPSDCNDETPADYNKNIDNGCSDKYNLNTTENSLQDNVSCENEAQFEPIEMRRLNKKRTKFIKGPSKFAHNQEELNNMLKDGWAPSDFDKNPSLQL